MKAVLISALLLSFSTAANASSGFCENSDSAARSAVQTVQLPLDSLLTNSRRDYASCMFAAGQISGAINASFSLLSDRNSSGCYKNERAVRDALSSIESIKQSLTDLCYEANPQSMLKAVGALRGYLGSIQ